MSVVLPIEDSPRFEIYTATTGQTTFAIPFPFQDDADIKALERIDDEWVEIDGGYTIVGAGNPSGGTVTFAVGRAEDEGILILGSAVLERLTSIVLNGRFSSKATDDELDRNRLIQQEVKREVDRAVKTSYGETAPTIDLGIPDGAVLIKQGLRLTAGPTGAAINSAETFAQQALASAGTASAAAGLAVGAAETSVEARDLALKFATNPEDVVVAGGLYSAFHWAKKAAQVVLDGLVDLSVTTGKIANGALAASAEGRAKMADAFLSADAAGRAKMADKFVTNAKLNDMVQATVKGRAAAAGTGVPVDLTATELLTIISGAPAYNKWETIEEVTLSAAASYIRTGLSAFYELELDGYVIPSANAVVDMHFSIDNGINWQTTADYLFQLVGVASGTSPAQAVTGTTQTAFLLSAGAIARVDDVLPLKGNVFGFNKPVRTRGVFVVSAITSAGVAYSYLTANWTADTTAGKTAKNALRILPSAGNLSGKFTLAGKRG